MRRSTWALAVALGCDPSGAPAAEDAPGGQAELGADSGAPADSADEPPLSGVELYLSRCVYCHGPDARGTADGPSLAPALAAQRPVAWAPMVVSGRGEMPAIEITRPEARRALRTAAALIAAD